VAADATALSAGLAACFGLGLLTGCAGPSRVDATLDAAPLVEPLPLNASIVFAEELRRHTHVIEGETFAESLGNEGCPSWYTPRWEFAVGPPVMQAFCQTYAGLFDRVTGCPGQRTPDADAGIDVVITQTINGFNLDCGMAAAPRIMGLACWANATFTVTATTADSETIAVWETAATAVEHSGPAVLAGFLLGDVHCAPLKGRVVAALMRDAVAQFVKAFTDSDALQAWHRENALLEADVAR